MTDAFGAWYGEIPCSLAPIAPRYVRARGLEPSVSTVAFPRSFFTASLAPERVADPFKLRDPALPQLLGRIHDAKTTTFLPIERPPFVADLVIAQGPPGKPPRTFTARQLYWVEGRIVDPRHGADALVEATLADIRRFWSDYGRITRDWNVGLPGTSAVRIGPDGKQVVRLAERRFVAHTAKEGGTQPTPLREIVQTLLNALPGKLQIVRWPDAYLAGKEPPEVRCWGARPKEVLRALFDAYNLELDVGSDLQVQVFGFGEGDVGTPPDAVYGGDSHDPVTGVGTWADQITADGDRYSRRPSHRPTAVEVIGDRTVFDVRVDFLTPVLRFEDRPEKEAPRTVVLEATPDNMLALARGQLLRDGPPQGEGALAIPAEVRSRINLILGAKDTDVVQLASFTVQGAQQATPAEPIDGLFWQRMVLQDDGAWSRSLPDMPEPVRAMVRAQLFRLYQLPAHLRRLLPLLDRAERDFKGDRLPIRVEAFTYQRTSALVRKPPKPGKPPLPENTDREVKLAKLRAIQGAIAEFEERKKRLEAPSLSEVAQALRSTYERRAGPTSAATADERALGQLFESWTQTGRKWLRAGANLIGLIGSTASDQGAASIAQAINEFTGAADGLTSDEAEARLAQIDRELTRLREQEVKAVADLNPRGALLRELGEIEAQIRAAAAGNGVIDSALRLRADGLRRQLAESDVQEAASKPKADEEPAFDERVYHLNLGRGEVAFRVVDADQGIIEILGGLPGWLGDPMVADPKSTFFVPMPVRIDFGTWNKLDPEQREVSDRPTFYVAVGLLMLELNPLLKPLANGLGHRLPNLPGEDQIRFTFTTEDQETGRADVGEFPWPILVDDPENPLRLLVRLPAAEDPEATRALIQRLSDPAGRTPDEIANRQARALELLATLTGTDNREELLRRARPLAKAALSAPAELDAGSLTVVGPRNVPCNGRVSAVQITLAGPGEGFVTEVSFAPDAAPLPGEEGPVRSSGPVRLVFGIDVERGRDR